MAKADRHRARVPRAALRGIARRSARTARRTTPRWSTSTTGAVVQHALGRVKPTNLERNPRAALTVVDPTTATVAGDRRPRRADDRRRDAQIDKLAKKYMGKDEYPWPKADETRVKVRIQRACHVYGLD